MSTEPALILQEDVLSIRPKDLPPLVTERVVLVGLRTVVEAKRRKDYASADLIKRVLAEFIEIKEEPDRIRWGWKPLTPESRYWT